MSQSDDQIQEKFKEGELEAANTNLEVIIESRADVLKGEIHEREILYSEVSPLNLHRNAEKKMNNKKATKNMEMKLKES
jgi:hypothetical protein